MSAVVVKASLQVTESWPTLRRMASQLTETFRSIAQRNQNYFVNDIPDELYIDTDPNLIATIFGHLLSAVVSNAKESCIRLSAKTYGNVILLHIKDYNSFDHGGVEDNLRQLQSLAEKAGGSVGITSHRQNVATFAFSFPNLPMAA
jgi:hypothetical protein